MATVLRFEAGLVPTLKHLAGQHDQTTHGRWAKSGLPHELEDVKGSLQKYFDAGLITKKNEVTQIRGRYEKNPNTGEYEFIQTAVPARDTLDQPFMSFMAPHESDDPEGYAIFQEAESKMLGGRYDDIQKAAAEEARALGMGDRQVLYYSQAVASRASLYVTMHNDILRNEAAQKTYSRDFADYKERGRNEYFEQKEKTIKTVSENIQKAFPVIAIESNDFLKVVEDGRFKTQHETRESNGAYRPALRREAELAIAGVPLDTKASERPIYGYLAVQKSGKTANTSPYNEDKWNINNSSVGQYGEVRVVLNDSVKARTSYTIPDSLDRYAIPQPLSRSSKEALGYAGVYHDLTVSHDGFQREGYAEAQVYGGVKIKDIKAVYIVSSGNKNYASTQSAISSALKAKGFDIPVEIVEGEKRR